MRAAAAGRLTENRGQNVRESGAPHWPRDLKSARLRGDACAHARACQPEREESECQCQEVRGRQVAHREKLTEWFKGQARTREEGRARARRTSAVVGDTHFQNSDGTALFGR